MNFEENRAQIILEKKQNDCFERLWNAVQMIRARYLLSDCRCSAWPYVPPAVQRHNSP